MPKHEESSADFKRMKSRIEGLESFLKTDRCRCWIRRDIRLQIEASLSSLTSMLNAFEGSYLKRAAKEAKK